MAEPSNTLDFLAKALTKGHAEAHRGILRAMMVIHMQVPLACHKDGPFGVLCEGMEHVIQEADPRVYGKQTGFEDIWPGHGGVLKGRIGWV